MENKEMKDVNGALKKLKGSSLGKIFGKTNLRFFEVSFKDKSFGYKINSKDKILRETHKFSEVTDFIQGVSESDKKKCEWKFGFYIKLSNKKTYILFAQSDFEFNKWIYAFKFILKRVPESFPVIPEKIFVIALNIFYYPLIREEENRIKQIEIEKKQQQQRGLELRQLHEDELRRKTLLKDDLKNRLYGDESNKKPKAKFSLYDENLDNIIKDADLKVENVNRVEKREKIIIPKSIEDSEKRTKIDKSNLLVEFKIDDHDDWNFYDENKTRIKDDQIINFNPILSKQNKKMGHAFHSAIKGYIDPHKNRSQLHLENMHLKNSNLDDDGSSIVNNKYFDVQKQDNSISVLNLNITNSNNNNNIISNLNNLTEFNPMKSIVEFRKSEIALEKEEKKENKTLGFLKKFIGLKLKSEIKNYNDEIVNKEDLIKSLNTQKSVSASTKKLMRKNTVNVLEYDINNNNLDQNKISSSILINYNKKIKNVDKNMNKSGFNESPIKSYIDIIPKEAKKISIFENEFEGFEGFKNNNNVDFKIKNNNQQNSLLGIINEINLNKNKSAFSKNVTPEEIQFI